MDNNSGSSSDLRCINTHPSLFEPGRERHLCERYRRAIRSYVGVLLRDEEAADDVAHNLYVKLLTPRDAPKNPFARYDPAKGRFRDYLRQSIRNAVKDHWKETERRPRSFEQDFDGRQDSGGDNTWISLWRRELISQSLKALKAYQESHPDNVFHLIVSLLGDSWTDGEPALAQGQSVEDDSQLAEELARRTGREWQLGNVRQQKSRARKKFAELLIEEIRSTLADPSRERIEEELQELRLLELVRRWLPEDHPDDGQDSSHER